MLTTIKNFVIHFFRRLTHLIIAFLFFLFAFLIFIITIEPGKMGKVTLRKVKRIRALTKFKVYLYKYCKPIFDFAHYKYFENLYNKYYFLIEN